MKRPKNPVKRFFIGILRAIVFIFNVGIPLKFVILLCALLVAGSVAFTSSRTIRTVGGKADYEEAMRYIEIKDTVEDHFVDTVNRDSMGAAAAAAMVNSLGDKWSYYMTESEYETYQISSANEYSGIGMSLIKDENSGGFQIVSVNPGSAAFNAGLGVGMVITKVDGQDVTAMDYDTVRTLIRSKMNTNFTVGVGKKDEYTVNCELTYKSTITFRKEKTEAGYLQIRDFEAGCADDCIKALENLLNQGIDSLVIDVRNNPGGLTGEVQKLLDYLLPEGTLFYLGAKDGKAEPYTSDSVCLSLPIVVLINSGTYAEAEVFAAVLQEYHWATLMGNATSGMTRTQETLRVSDGSAIRLSTKTYLTANGVDIAANHGVIPESIVFNTDESATGTTQGTTGGEDGTASTSNDEQLMAALTYLSKTVV
ncbi:MAG: S41 family peptidase [Oscillospiraceae bacterium]|nr:S41 family peptidase [Oscillospiraceae bacterium]